MKAIFTIPKIVKPKDENKDWVIYFRYNGTPIRKKYGINYIKDLKKRQEEAELICQGLHLKLKKDWNPLVPDFEENLGNTLTIGQALDFSVEKKTENNISKSTIDDYKLTVKWAKTAIKKLNLGNLMICELKRIHVKTIMGQIKKDRSWSNHAYNKNFGYFRAILGELIEWEIIEFNPASNIKSLKVDEQNSNVPASDREAALIKEHLKKKFHSFYLFNSMLFHTGIRPEEILQITIGMIDMDENVINIPPEITKTGRYRLVPINRFLKSDLESMNLRDHPKSYFVFGTRRGGCRNRGVKPDTDFIPAPDNLHSNTATKLWRILVKDELGIKVNLYSEKHRGANKKILAGMDLDSLRELYGHTSKLMTEKYAKVVKEVYRKQIMENSPDF